MKRDVVSLLASLFLAGCQSFSTDARTLGAISGAATVVAILPPVCRPGSSPPSIGADSIPQCGHHRSLIVNEENDAYGGGSDESYTNGFGLRIESGQASRPARSALRRLGRWIPRGSGWARSPDCDAVTVKPARCLTSSIGIVQAMYTPSNRYTTAPDTTDRPYSGALQLRYGIRRGSSTDATEIALQAGVLGQSAQGERTQTWIHKHLARVPPFEGWHNQIPDRGLFGVEWTRRRRFVRELHGGLSMDATPVLGAVAGNWMDYGRVGSQVRFGYGLTPVWGLQRLTEVLFTRFRPDTQRSGIVSSPATADPRFEFGVFTEGEARGVLYNASLDRTPLTVPKPWAHHTFSVLEGAMGLMGRVDLSRLLCTRFPDLAASYRYVWRSREVEGPALGPSTGTHRYGVLLVGVARRL